MKRVQLALAGWLIPGGAFLLLRRYRQFAVFAVLVCLTFAAGVALDGSFAWPQPAELAGLGGFDWLLAQGGAAAKLLAGAPYLIAQLIGGGQPWLGGILHEYGTTLLSLAGLFNLLGVACGVRPRRDALMPHFTFTLVSAALVTAAIGASEDRPASERPYRTAYLFLCSIAVVVAGSWIMRAIHG